VNIGFFGNSVLPLRAGEILRAYLLTSRWKVPFVSSIATIATERVFDLFGVMIFLFLALIFKVFPPEVISGDSVTASILSKAAIDAPIILVIFLILAYSLIYGKDKWERLILKISDKLPGQKLKRIGQLAANAIESFSQGLSIFKKPLLAIRCIWDTFWVWFCIVLAEWFILLAFGLKIPILGAGFMMVMIAFAVAAPQAPGYIGVFQLATKFVLVKFFNVPEATSVSIAIILWLTQVPTVILGGFICLYIEGLSLADLKEYAKQDEDE